MLRVVCVRCFILVFTFVVVLLCVCVAGFCYGFNALLCLVCVCVLRALLLVFVSA